MRGSPFFFSPVHFSSFPMFSKTFPLRCFSLSLAVPSLFAFHTSLRRIRALGLYLVPFLPFSPSFPPVLTSFLLPLKLKDLQWPSSSRVLPSSRPASHLSHPPSFEHVPSSLPFDSCRPPQQLFWNFLVFDYSNFSPSCLQNPLPLTNSAAAPLIISSFPPVFLPTFLIFYSQRLPFRQSHSRTCRTLPSLRDLHSFLCPDRVQVQYVGPPLYSPPLWLSPTFFSLRVSLLSCKDCALSCPLLFSTPVLCMPKLDLEVL